MTKQEVVEQVADRCDLSKAAAGRALGAMLDTLTEVMADGEEVSFTGFGKFHSQRRRARDGVNPQDPTQKIRIRAANVPKFKPGVTLREAVSQSPVAAQTDGSPVDGRSAGSGEGAGAPSSVAAPTEKPEWRPLGERG